MAKYKTRPGVVLTTVCGENLLVAARAALEYCPYVTQLNDSSAYLWKKLAAGVDSDRLLDEIEAEFEVDDPEALRSAIDGFIKQMTELRYLLPDEQKG